MEQLETIRGRAAPLLRNDVDTDQILPAQYMAQVLVPMGLKAGLFAQWRLMPDGKDRADFILNRVPYANASILLAGRNFGCGSSREQAPRALRQWGFRAIVAPSFGEIFYGNCFRNGILPVVLAEPAVQAIAAQVAGSDGLASLDIDLRQNVLIAPDGTRHVFSSPPRLRQMLLHGMSEIDLTLRFRHEVQSFVERDRHARRWAYF